jgi:hyperosmotically inducible protein
MTSRSLSATLIASLLLIPLATFAAKTPGERVDDTALATSVKAALIADRQVDAGHINVETYKGVVQLGGFVESESERNAALNVATDVNGAKQVLDAMVVLTGSRTFGQTVTDTEIQSKLRTRLSTIKSMDNSLRINTEVRQGHVLLSGFVAVAEHKRQAGEIAAGIADVVEVHNLIATKP